MSLKAGALYYAILISFVVGAILSLMLLHFSTTEKNIQVITGPVLHKQSVKGAIELSLSKPNIIWNGSFWSTSVFKNITLKAKPWGLFYNIWAEGVFKNDTIRYCAMTGVANDSDSTVLYISDTKTGFNISGTTKIVGDVFLPKGTYKKVAFLGKYSTIDNPIIGNLKTSSVYIPKSHALIFEKIESRFKGDAQDGELVLWDQRLPSKLNHSFFNQTKCFKYSEDIYLKRMNLSGNCIIQAENEVIVSSQAKLEHVQLYGRKILIKSGFDGVIQAIAQDTIVIERGCKLRYPSCVVVANYQGADGYIEIQSNTDIAGGVFLYRSVQEKNKPKCIIDPGSQIFGTIAVDGTVELMGEVYGSLYARKVGFETSNRAKYINQLHNKELSFYSISNNFVRPLYFMEVKKMEMIQWLN